tara:strand:- start:7972 stop:8709 length:738 start_codon:yes stop_codon:yes gene_type:complete
MDPLTITAAVSVASKAFDAIKKGFQIGRDMESMGKDVSRWMSAVSDVDNAEKMAKNPPLFKKLFAAGSVEEEAMQAYIAKKKLQEQRQELKTWLNLSQGPNAYNELLQMEGKIRKQRQDAIYAQQQLRRKVLEWIGIGLLTIIIVSFILFLAYLYGNRAHAAEWTNQQKVWQGISPEKKYTTCRLIKRVKSRITRRQACIYRGGNKTYTLMYEDSCPRSYQCIYNPGGTEPNIDDVIESLNSIKK